MHTSKISFHLNSLKCQQDQYVSFIFIDGKKGQPHQVPTEPCWNWYIWQTHGSNHMMDQSLFTACKLHHSEIAYVIVTYIWSDSIHTYRPDKMRWEPGGAWAVEGAKQPWFSSLFSYWQNSVASTGGPIVTNSRVWLGTPQPCVH